MTDGAPLPTSIRQAELSVMGVTLVVHHLDDGRRIIESAGMAALFEAMNSGTEMTAEDAETIAHAVRGAI